MKKARFFSLAFAITLIIIVAQTGYAGQCTWDSCAYSASSQHYHFYYAEVYCGYMGHGLYLGDVYVWSHPISSGPCQESESSYLSPQSGNCGQHVGWNPGSGNPGYSSHGNVEGSISVFRPIPMPEDPSGDCPTPMPEDPSGDCPTPMPEDPNGDCPTPMPEDPNGDCPTPTVQKDVWLDSWNLWYDVTPTLNHKLPEDLKWYIETQVGIAV